MVRRRYSKAEPLGSLRELGRPAIPKIASAEELPATQLGPASAIRRAREDGASDNEWMVLSDKVRMTDAVSEGDI
jgi:hypothetical protein